MFRVLTWARPKLVPDLLINRWVWSGFRCAVVLMSNSLFPSVYRQRMRTACKAKFDRNSLPCNYHLRMSASIQTGLILCLHALTDALLSLSMSSERHSRVHVW